MILNPTTIITMDDWVADVVPDDRKRKRFRVGLSPASMTEEEAFAVIDRMLKWRRVGPCDVTLKRRWQWQVQNRPNDPRLLERYLCGM